MKFIAKLLLIFVIAIPCSVRCQTVELTVNDIKWSLASSVRAFEPQRIAVNLAENYFSDTFSYGMIQLEDHSVISRVQLDKHNYGMVRLNKDLTVKWLNTLDLGGRHFLFNGKLLVIISTLSPDGSDYVYKLTIIDPETGNVVSTKDLITVNGEFLTDASFLVSPDSKSLKLVVRTSGVPLRGNLLMNLSMNKNIIAFNNTTDFKIIEFDSNLNIKSTVKPQLEQGDFIGAAMDNKQNVYIMSMYSQGMVKMAKYGNGETKPARVLQLPVNMSDKINSEGTQRFLIRSKYNPDIYYFVTMYDNANNERELVVASFDFKNGLAKSDVQVMDKAYLKNLTKSYIPFSKKFDDIYLGDKFGTRIDNIIETDGKLIVAISGSSNASLPDHYPYYHGHDVIFNIYDDKANLQYQQIIPRQYSTFRPDLMGVGLHCTDNVLYVTMNSGKHLNETEVLFGKINLKTGLISDITFVPKDDINHKYEMDPTASIWYDNKVILSYLEIKGWSAGSEDAHMQLVGY